MTRLRRALAPLAAMWLSCQIGTVALVPVALWVSAADSHAAECTCGHGADAMCPMHHHKPTGNTNGNCAMQAAKSPATAVLTALVGVAGGQPKTTTAVVCPGAPPPLRNSHPGGPGGAPSPPPPPPPPPPSPR